MSSTFQTGALYVVATPIGNLQDISFRAIDILSRVDQIAVEDTRHSMKLLRHYNIDTKCISLHEHNERQITTDLIEKLKNGVTIALISDAGTPLVSDPGYYLVKSARYQDIPVVPIPGPCAFIAALSVSGLPTDRFHFEGFLPAKRISRTKRLLALSQEPQTIVFYESPHRIVDTIEDLMETFGPQREIAFAKELTKIHETVFKGTVIDLRDWILADPVRQKGEIVLLVQGAELSNDTNTDPEIRKLLSILMAELPLKQAVHLTAQYTNGTKNDIYALALALKKQTSN